MEGEQTRPAAHLHRAHTGQQGWGRAEVQGRMHQPKALGDPQDMGLAPRVREAPSCPAMSSQTRWAEDNPVGSLQPRVNPHQGPTTAVPGASPCPESGARQGCTPVSHLAAGAWSPSLPGPTGRVACSKATQPLVTNRSRDQLPQLATAASQRMPQQGPRRYTPREGSPAPPRWAPQPRPAQSPRPPTHHPSTTSTTAWGQWGVPAALVPTRVAGVPINTRTPGAAGNAPLGFIWKPGGSLRSYRRKTGGWEPQSWGENSSGFKPAPNLIQPRTAGGGSHPPRRRLGLAADPGAGAPHPAALYPRWRGRFSILLPPSSPVRAAAGLAAPRGHPAAPGRERSAAGCPPPPAGILPGAPACQPRSCPPRRELLPRS